MEKIWLYAGKPVNPAVLVGELKFIGSDNLTGADNQQERLELLITIEMKTFFQDINNLFI